MSLPKFNLSKLRDSVAQQQAVTKKDIANLLLLDRLQAMVKSQKPKAIKRESLDNFITIDITMTKSSKDENFYLYNTGDDNYVTFDIDLENMVRQFLFNEDDYFKGYADDKTKYYFGIEDKYELAKEETDGVSTLFLTIKIPLENAIKRLKKHFYSTAEDKEGALPQYELGLSRLLDKLNKEANDLSNIIDGSSGVEDEDQRKTAIKAFNENVEFIKENTTGWDKSSFPLLEENATEGDGLPFIVGLIVDSIDVY